MQLLRALGTR